MKVTSRHDHIPVDWDVKHQFKAVLRSTISVTLLVQVHYYIGTASRQAIMHVTSVVLINR